VHNPELAADFARRAAVRVRAVELLFAAASWADVVREAQEVVELALKGVLLASGIEPPRIHDVSEILLAERSRMPTALEPDLERLAGHSRELRRDRELAFYGAADLIPSGFYSEADAQRALAAARDTAACVARVVPGSTPVKRTGRSRR
jgi:HEPN domain-containing protein